MFESWWSFVVSLVSRVMVDGWWFSLVVGWQRRLVGVGGHHPLHRPPICGRRFAEVGAKEDIHGLSSIRNLSTTIATSTLTLSSNGRRRCLALNTVHDSFFDAHLFDWWFLGQGVGERALQQLHRWPTLPEPPRARGAEQTGAERTDDQCLPRRRRRWRHRHHIPHRGSHGQVPLIRSWWFPSGDYMLSTLAWSIPLIPLISLIPLIADSQSDCEFWLSMEVDEDIPDFVMEYLQSDQGHLDQDIPDHILEFIHTRAAALERNRNRQVFPCFDSFFSFSLFQHPSISFGPEQNLTVLSHQNYFTESPWISIRLNKSRFLRVKYFHANGVLCCLNLNRPHSPDVINRFKAVIPSSFPALLLQQSSCTRFGFNCFYGSILWAGWSACRMRRRRQLQMEVSSSWNRVLIDVVIGWAGRIGDGHHQHGWRVANLGGDSSAIGGAGSESNGSQRTLASADHRHRWESRFWSILQAGAQIIELFQW